MSMERAIRKLDVLEQKMQASYPVWNIDGSIGRCSLLLRATTPNGRCKFYRMGERLFSILNLTVSGLSNTDISHFLGISYKTVKNQQVNLGLLFEENGRIPLVLKLIKEGVLTFEPRIPENEWVGLKETSKVKAA